MNKRFRKWHVTIYERRESYNGTQYNESDPAKNSKSHDSLSSRVGTSLATSVVATESLSERVIRAKSSGSPYRNHAPPGHILRRHIYGSVSHSLKCAAPGEKPG